MANTHDYLAVILIGTGSSWGRAPVKEEAVQNAIRNYRDWGVYYKVADTDVIVNVVDVGGFDVVSWDDRGVYGKRDGESVKLDRPIEQQLHHTPNWRKRR
jgi:hypothetical protein